MIWRFIFLLFITIRLLSVPPALSADNANAIIGSEVGLEMLDAEKQILEASQTPPAGRTEVSPEQPPPKLEPAEKEDARPPSSSQSFNIYQIEIRGDRCLLDALNLRQELVSEVVGKTLTAKDILDIGSHYQQLCAKSGYYLTIISVVPVDYSKGVLIYDVDAGRLGRMTFYEAGKDPEGAGSRTPFRERYFSEKQIRRRLSALCKGHVFHYKDFYRAVFSVNTHPDITLDSELNIRKKIYEGRRIRYVDMDFFVDEDLPLHTVLDVNNTGTEATEEWRAGVTIQHLNLTKHDDILTLSGSASMDFSTLFTAAAGYYVPHYMGRGGAFTLYGGYSRIEAKDVVPMIDLQGNGWFGGLQSSFKLVSGNKHILTMHLGGVYRELEDNVVFQGEPAPERKATVVPLSAALSYSSVRPDFLGGRNFITGRTSFNIGESLGGSDDKELGKMRIGAESDYFIGRLQMARLQPLFGRTTGKGRKTGLWILFIKLAGQVAGGTLIPAEQKAIGGADTVRGHVEREFRGDNGVSGTLELRTPLMTGIFSGKKAGGRAIDRLQFVMFADGGYVAYDNPQAGEKKSQTIGGAGLGLRLSLTSHAQLKLDWGRPFEETEESKSDGRGHLRFQIQF